MSDETVLGQIIPLIFFLVGLALLIGALWQTARTRAFLATAAETGGTVIDLEQEPPTESGDLPGFRPVIAFQSAAGTALQFKATVLSNPPEYDIGAAVRVLYDPARPGEARLRSFTSLWLLPLVVAGLGLIFSGLGAGLLLGYFPL